MIAVNIGKYKLIIARRRFVNKNIIKSNNMKKKFIVAAGALVGVGLLSTQQTQASTYTVKSGDTISSIAQKTYNTYSPAAIETIVQANNIPNRDLIFVGDKLQLPETVKAINENKAVNQAPTQPKNNENHIQVSTPSQQQQQNVASKNNNSQNNNNTTSTKTNTSSVGGGDLRSYVTSKMAAETGVSAETWAKIISRESNWNPTITNSSGYYGLFQLAPGYEGNGGSVEQQIQGAVGLYKKQGLAAWSETAY